MSVFHFFFYKVMYFFFFGWCLLLFGRFSSCVCHVLTESFWSLDAKKEMTARRITRITLTLREYISMPHCMPFNIFLAFLLASGVTVIWASPRFGHPHPKTLVMWLSQLTLIQIATVVWEGDACIATVLGMGMLKTQGCPYHCHTGVLHWFYYEDVRLSLRHSGPVPHKINKFATLLQVIK